MNRRMKMVMMMRERNKTAAIVIGGAVTQSLHSIKHNLEEDGYMDTKYENGNPNVLARYQKGCEVIYVIKHEHRHMLGGGPRARNFADVIRPSEGC